MNPVHDRETLHDEEASGLLLLLAPFAPHLAEELWARLGKAYSVHQQPFPVASASLVNVAMVSVPVQVNSRTRGVMQLPPEANQAQALDAARHIEVVRQALEDGSFQRIVYVPRRILNIVTRGH